STSVYHDRVGMNCDALAWQSDHAPHEIVSVTVAHRLVDDDVAAPDCGDARVWLFPREDVAPRRIRWKHPQLRDLPSPEKVRVNQEHEGERYADGELPFLRPPEQRHAATLHASVNGASVP